MYEQNIPEHCVKLLKSKNIDKSECMLIDVTNYEFYSENYNIIHLKTSTTSMLKLKAIKDDKCKFVSINNIDEKFVNEAIQEVADFMRNFVINDAYDISPKQVKKEFISGDTKPNLEKMYMYLKDFLNTVKSDYCNIIIDVRFSFKNTKTYFVNSNGVDFKSSIGVYKFSASISSKNDYINSSLNYTKFSLKRLDKKLIECGSIKKLLTEIQEQLKVKNINDRFNGDLIITPDCFRSILNYYINIFLNEKFIISGTSMLKDKLEKQITSEKLSISCSPIEDEICDGYFITNDGFEAQNQILIERGILKNFLLSLYGANKTKHNRFKNMGGAFIVESGEKTINEMIKNIKKGIIIGRLSGGHPNIRGDFLFIAKNSYFIENGKILFPLGEVRVSCNLYNLFMDIKDISKERINFGDTILPWIHSIGVISS